jgi:hypothetical protein
VAKIPKVTQMVRRKVNGRWKHVRATIAANGQVKSLPGDGSFCLRYKQKGKDIWEPIEGGADAALAAKKRRELAFQAVAMGIAIPALEKDAKTGRLTIDGAIQRYFSDEVPDEGQLPEWNAD